MAANDALAQINSPNQRVGSMSNPYLQDIITLAEYEIKPAKAIRSHSTQRHVGFKGKAQH